MSPALFLLLLPLAAFAQPAAPPGDWASLNAQLNVRGVNPASVNWPGVNQACGGLRGDDAAYNACRLEKAYDERRYWSDRRRCERRVTYPRYGDIQPFHIHIYAPDMDAETVARLHRNFQARSLLDYRRHRYRYVDECMEDEGWIDPGSWRMGRKAR